jgi:hypothetical protein
MVSHICRLTVLCKLSSNSRPSFCNYTPLMILAGILRKTKPILLHLQLVFSNSLLSFTQRVLSNGLLVILVKHHVVIGVPLGAVVRQLLVVRSRVLHQAAFQRSLFPGVIQDWNLGAMVILVVEYAFDRNIIAKLCERIFLSSLLDQFGNDWMIA